MSNRTGGNGRRRLSWYTGAGALMVLPILPERLSGAVRWDPSDFIFLAFLLGGVAAISELAARTSARHAYAAAVGVAIAAMLLQLWMNLAVGIIGSEENPANLIYTTITAAAVIGSTASGFRASGMAAAMTFTAFVQTMVFVVLWVTGFGFTGPITVFFVALWLNAAWLFRRAASQDDTPVSPIERTMT